MSDYDTEFCKPYTVKQLREKCKQFKLKGYSKLKRKDLIQLVAYSLKKELLFKQFDVEYFLSRKELWTAEILDTITSRVIGSMNYINRVKNNQDIIDINDVYRMLENKLFTDFTNKYKCNTEWVRPKRCMLDNLLWRLSFNVKLDLDFVFTHSHLEWDWGRIYTTKFENRMYDEIYKYEDEFQKIHDEGNPSCWIYSRSYWDFSKKKDNQKSMLEFLKLSKKKDASRLLTGKGVAFNIFKFL